MNAGILVAVMLALGPADGAEKGEAAQRAEAAFDAGDFETAATAAAQAYKAEGDPVYLYVQAQAERFGGRCEPAIVHYREFIEAVPAGQAADAARDNIAECEQALAERPSTADPPPPDPVEPLGPAPVEDPPPDDPSPDSSDQPPDPVTPWHRDVLGGVLVGTGAVALAVGGGLYGVAKADERGAEQAVDVGTYGERIDRAYTLSRAAIPVMVTGGVLVVAGVVRWAVVARKGKRSPSARRSAGVALGSTGVALRF